MKKMKYFILGLVGALSWSLYSCQNDGVEESDINETEGVFTVTEVVTTKGSTPITGGTGNYKTGENARITAAYGATIFASRTSGSGSAGQTYQDDDNREAYLNIDDIHGDWEVTATLPDPKQYTVTVKAETGGTVSGGGSVTEGSSCDIEATENAGYTFNGWTVTEGTATIGNSSSKRTTVSPSSDCTVIASFKQKAAKPITVSVSLSAEISSDNQSIIFTAELSDNIEHPSISISGYVTANYTDQADAVMSIPENSSTSSLTWDSYNGNITHITSPIIISVSPTEWTDSKGQKYVLSH